MLLLLFTEHVIVVVYIICYCCLQNSEMFETYKNLCCRAFLTLRRNADLIISLFSLVT